MATQTNFLKQNTRWGIVFIISFVIFVVSAYSLFYVYHDNNIQPFSWLGIVYALSGLLSLISIIAWIWQGSITAYVLLAGCIILYQIFFLTVPNLDSSSRDLYTQLGIVLLIFIWILFGLRVVSVHKHSSNQIASQSNSKSKLVFWTILGIILLLTIIISVPHLLQNQNDTPSTQQTNIQNNSVQSTKQVSSQTNSKPSATIDSTSLTISSLPSAVTGTAVNLSSVSVDVIATNLGIYTGSRNVFGRVVSVINDRWSLTIPQGTFSGFPNGSFIVTVQTIDPSGTSDVLAKEKLVVSPALEQ